MTTPTFTFTNERFSDAQLKRTSVGNHATLTIRGIFSSIQTEMIDITSFGGEIEVTPGITTYELVVTEISVTDIF